MAILTLYPAVERVIQDTLAQPYVAGSGTMVLTAGGAAFAANPTKFNVITAATYNQGPDEQTAVYQCTGQSGNILSGVSVLDGSSDQDFPAGSYVEIRLNAIDINSLNTLVLPFNAPGATGFVLTSTGPGTAPTWQVGGGGGYVAPTFTSFAISGQSSTVEVGATIASGSHTFTWATSTSGNVAANSISIADTTASTTLATGLADDGTEAISFGSSITNASPATHTWTIAGTDTQSGSFNRTYSVSWQWRVWSGSSALPELTNVQVQALGTSTLGSSIAGTYAMTGSGYKYIAVPTTFAAPNAFIDASTGFNVPMCMTANDASFSGTDGNGNNYIPLTLTNANSIAQAYACYRSLNNIGGNLTIGVS